MGTGVKVAVGVGVLVGVGVGVDVGVGVNVAVAVGVRLGLLSMLPGMGAAELRASAIQAGNASQTTSAISRSRISTARI